MTTNPTRVVELKINGSWVDVSGWVDIGPGGEAIVITRGRENEQADTQPGTCTFSLVNDDGRFSLDLTTGAYYPYFRRWIEVRVTIKGSRRFTGYVSNVATTLDDDTGLHAHSAITCTDALGIQAMSPAATSWSDELIGDLSPLYWWKLNEPSDSTVAVEANGGPSLIPTVLSGTADIGDMVEFGTEGPSILEAETLVHVEPAWDSGTATSTAALVCASTLSGLATSTAGITILCIYSGEGYDPARPTGETWKSPLLTFVLGSTTIDFYTSNFGGNALPSVHEESSTDVADASSYVSGVQRHAGIVAVTLDLTTISILGAANPAAATVARASGTSYNGATLRVGGGGKITGRTNLAHVAILNGKMSAATYDGLASKIANAGTGAVSDWLTHALDASGLPPTLTFTSDRQMKRTTLKGSNPLEIATTFAQACGGAYMAARDGTPTWLDPTYCPARVEIPFEHIDPDVSREPDESLSYTDVTVDGVVIASSGGWPKGERDVPGLLPDSSLAKYATWLANTADVWARGRFSQLPIDLLPLDSATTDAYLALDVRSRILPTGVPPQFPADMVYTVEGSSETATKDTWQITLNTAPDPRFVLGESLLGSDYRLGWE